MLQYYSAENCLSFSRSRFNVFFLARCMLVSFVCSDHAVKKPNVKIGSLNQVSGGVPKAKSCKDINRDCDNIILAL